MDQCDYDHGLHNLLANQEDHDTIPVLDDWSRKGMPQISTPAAAGTATMEYGSGVNRDFGEFSNAGFQSASTWTPDHLLDPGLLPPQGQYEPTSIPNALGIMGQVDGQAMPPQGTFGFTYPPPRQAQNPLCYEQPHGAYPGQHFYSTPIPGSRLGADPSCLDMPQTPLAPFNHWAPASKEKPAQHPLPGERSPQAIPNSSVKKYTTCEGDVRAAQAPNIEYVSDNGETFKGSEVRWNPLRGWFIPLHQRTKDGFKKRGGFRPGTKNPLYEVCKWNRGNKTADSECLGVNVYGTEFSVPEDWELPNGKGTISYDKDGCFPVGATLTAEQIRLYIDNNPRLPKFRIFVANCPSQASHRTFENKQCIWSGCPCPNRTLRQGYHQVIFDEYSDQTDAGERDPFRVAGRMHLWCFEQCCDIVEDFKRGLVKPETRSLRREQKNAMALDRDCNKTIERETYDPWFRHHIERMGATQRLEARPFEESLAYVLTAHHLKNQTSRRQAVRDERNLHKIDPRSLDITEGSVLKLHQQKQDVSNGWLEVASQEGRGFQASRIRNTNYRLPEYVGSKATGLGVVLEGSLTTTKGARRSGRVKRSRAEFQSDSDSGGNDAAQHREENAERPRKVLRRESHCAPPPMSAAAPSNIGGLAVPAVPAQDEVDHMLHLQPAMDPSQLAAVAHAALTQAGISPNEDGSPTSELSSPASDGSLFNDDL